MPDGSKRCGRCGETKPLASFPERGGKRKGERHSWCRACLTAYRKEQYRADPERERRKAREWAAKNRPRINAQRKAYKEANPEAQKRYQQRDRERHPDRWIRTHYGLTRERWDAILAAQGGGCAICGATVPRGIGRFHVDHDHDCCPGKGSCGKCIRGLLCNRCNPMLGYACDDASLLRAAADYLDRWTEAMHDRSPPSGAEDARAGRGARKHRRELA